jgi:gamma-butyrobetaine dioxygenase
MRNLASGQTIPAAHLLPAWLRDNCPCPACRDPGSGQRLISIVSQAPDVTVRTAIEAADGLHITFGPDGHQAVFAWSWLADQSGPAAGERGEDGRRLWTGCDFLAGPPVTSWQSYRTDDKTRLECLRGLLSAGFLLLRSVPAEPGAVLDVVASFGYVRETSDGRLFDVPAQTAAASPAATGPQLGPHTDQPYRDPVPTLQLLHCLANAAGGGRAGLLDGFAAAAALRADDPAAFECLAAIPVTFCHTGSTAELRATRPMIGLTTDGRIREIRYNSGSMQPLRPRRRMGAEAAGAQLREFYRAYRAFATILHWPDRELKVSLDAGDCVLIDNTRVLHSWTGFTGAGQRLQGCYADLDGAESTVAVLARRAAQRRVLGL